MRREKGITLVALIITIIVLVILVGVSVSAIMNKGIISNSKTATDKYAETQAEEKLAVTLAGAQTEKYINPNYNEEQYLTDYITNQIGATVSGNIVILEGYTFEIDRNVPKISVVIGKGEKDSSIVIKNITPTVSADYTKATIAVEVESKKAITKIVINGQEVNEISNAEGTNTYTASKDVGNNGTYSIIAYAEDKYNYNTVGVTGISEDMVIKTVEEFKQFRDKVNSGATYEGRTITLASDIDLSGSCGANINGVEISWEPIGIEEVNFQGNFNGDYHSIENLYINSAKYINSGLFGMIGENGTIQNLNLKGEYIYSNNSANGEYTYTGGIAGYNKGKISRCANIKTSDSNQIYGYINATGQYKSSMVGGIVGQNDGEILECYNTNSVFGKSDGHNERGCYIGGISGGYGIGKIDRCYNRGDLMTLNTRFALIGGIVADAYTNTRVLNSYSSCNISTNTTEYMYSFSCGIVARVWENKGAQCLNSYYETRDNITYAWNINNSSSWMSGFNKSAEELKNQTMIDLLNKDLEEKNWTMSQNGINNGYPILKWQLEH